MGLTTARGGALRHLTTWPGSYTAVLRIGRTTTTILGDLAGACPVCHAAWAGSTAYATAALPLADLIEAPFFDNQVVRACQALPETLRVRPGARAAVLRSVLAATGIRDLPAGPSAPSQAFSAMSARTGLRVPADALQDLFSAPLLADADLIEARVVRGALRDAAEGAALPLDGLAELVATELWLHRLLARRGSCWTGSEAPRQPALAQRVAPRLSCDRPAGPARPGP